MILDADEYEMLNHNPYSGEASALMDANLDNRLKLLLADSCPWFAS
jgi:hypothetical protein